MKFNRLDQIPEYRAAQERLVELQLKLRGAESRRDDVQGKITLFDELSAPASGRMQRSEIGRFGAPPDHGARTIEGNTVDSLTEQAAQLTTDPDSIPVHKRVSRDALVAELHAAMAEIRVLEKAIELQRGLVEQARATGSKLILEQAAPEYLRLVREHIAALERASAAEAAMRDYWSAFYDDGLIGLDLRLPPMPRTGIGRKSEDGSRLNVAIRAAEEMGALVPRKAA